MSEQPGLVFRNDMSRSFRLTRALFVLDGVVLLDEVATAETSLPSEIPLHQGTMRYGKHIIQVLLQLRDDEAGLREYKFEVKSTHEFTVVEGRSLRVEVVAWEKGDNQTPFQERPALRYIERIGPISVPASEQPLEHADTETAPKTEPQPTPQTMDARAASARLEPDQTRDEVLRLLGPPVMSEFRTKIGGDSPKQSPLTWTYENSGRKLFLVFEKKGDDWRLASWHWE